MEQVYAAKGDEDGSYKWGFVWLAFGVPFFILAVLFTLVIGDLTCQIQATFNGALFYYVFLDAAMLFLCVAWAGCRVFFFGGGGGVPVCGIKIGW